ncbi:MAG: substrate-binding and VWA domain-containing protein [Frankiaceae bacterium]
MPEILLPRGFDAVLAERARRRQRRRRITALIGAGAALVAAAVGTVAAKDRRSPAVAASSTPPCPGTATPLVIAASADKAALLNRFAADFDRRGRDAQGRCVHVTVENKSSGAAATALANGWPDSEGPRPDVWSPSSSIWLPLLESRLVDAQRSSLIPVPDAVPSIATSPMVVAMPRPMAEALGWPQRPVGWSDLLQLAASGTGWATFKHPEWGKFSLGKTNPNFSHAGLEGTIATYYAAVGRTSGLSRQDIDSASTRRFVAGVEQAIVRYGDNTATFLSDWLRADDAGRALEYISALVTEENLVPAYNAGNPTDDTALVGTHPAPRVPLVAIYPKEGTFLANHPYAVLSAGWVTPAKRAAADAFLRYLLSPEVQLQWQTNHFRDAHGRAGPGDNESVGVLPRQPARILQPPSPEITHLILDSWSQVRKTANVLSLIDVSGSMNDQAAGSSATKLDAAKQAAVASLKLFTDRDEVGLWAFSGGVRGKTDYRRLVDIGPMNGAVGHAVRRDVLAKAIMDLKAAGDTGLYNTIAAAYQTVLDRYGDDQINAVVVVTDGKNDADGGLDLAGLLHRIDTTSGGRPIRIITIAYGKDADQAALAQIARATKGAAYLAPTPADIPKVYSSALSNL